MKCDVLIYFEIYFTAFRENCTQIKINTTII